MKRIEESLRAANIPYAYDGFFPTKPPKPPYAVILDQVNTEGADLKPLRKVHSPTVEIYTDTVRGEFKDAKERFTDELIANGLRYSQYEPAYITTESKYQVVFDIEDISEKIR